MMEQEIFGGAWKLTPGAERSQSRILYDSRRNEDMVRFGWSKLNNIAESEALTEKCRYHGKLDNCEAQIEFQKVYPYGGESVIDRTLTVRDKLIEVRVDVKPGRGEVVKSFELEELFFPGEFEKIEIIRLPEVGKTAFELEKLNVADGMIYDSSRPWVVLLLTTPDGAQLEMGIGGDLWRMQGAGSSSWQIIKNNDGVKLLCLPVDLSSAETVERRPWRFNYYLCWGRVSGGITPPDKAALVLTPDLRKEVKSSCFRAPAVRKFLRKLVRRQQENPVDLVLNLPDAEFCNDAGHLERPGKKELLHWDLDELFALYSWGNRQLGYDHQMQIMLPEDSIFRKLPSGKYLGNAPGETALRDC